MGFDRHGGDEAQDVGRVRYHFYLPFRSDVFYFPFQRFRHFSFDHPGYQIAEAVVMKMRGIEDSILDSEYELAHLSEEEQKRLNRKRMMEENKARKARQAAGN